ncbi:SPFH domain-containing protein [Perlabentimonas gracilis]|uniref:SPFH domain-containing protein n=1 Tax=Perlabentimonas gracilis TaxID=2715279 RepID=UPI001409111E|nr:SPFH domain-containing protein [Perlabentimonas gracilis]NHB68133.1 SPFH domain-containing protein [Perlabentimonas gracilis]
MKTQEEPFKGLKLNGILMLIFNFLLLFGIVFLFIKLVSTSGISPLMATLSGIGLGVLFVLNCIFWGGFMQIEPNETRVMVFFGKYEGTVKENGFFWVNPFYAKQKLTLRARNLDADPIKVNDKSGNPIMIGMVLVWRLFDTYKASFHVDNASMAANTAGATSTARLNEKMMAYQNFVKIQCDAALRYVAGMFAYDMNEAESAKELTLRSHGDDINKILEEQINERLAIAGIEVVEARINYLAYAPEIAAVMLRRQQADAIISAREKIVEGAVGMVKLALDKLAEEKTIEFDDEKKAAMISNLMVVLCSEESATPIVNAGTLHQ